MLILKFRDMPLKRKIELIILGCVFLSLSLPSQVFTVSPNPTNEFFTVL